MNIRIILLLIFLIMSSLMDIKTKKISLCLCIAFLLIGMGWNTFCHFKGIIHILDIVVSIIPGGILILLSLVTKQEIGLGDGIVVIIIGMLIGVEKTVMSLMTGLFISAFFSSFLIYIKKVQRSYQIPFIPFLTVGVVLVVIGGV